MAAWLAVLFFWTLPLSAKDNPLVGSWTLNGAPYAELRADGTGVVGAFPCMWQADGKRLVLQYANGSGELMTYKIAGGKLTVTMNGQSKVLERGKKASKDAKRTAGAPAKTGKGGAAGKDSLSALLLSSPWCSFSYNQVSGASHQERVVFHRDGTWGSGARGETYSSGQGGTYAGQADSSGGGRWQVQGGTLWLSEGAGALEDAGLTVTRNSSGYPILKSGGKEYSQCR